MEGRGERYRKTNDQEHEAIRRRDERTDGRADDERPPRALRSFQDRALPFVGNGRMNCRPCVPRTHGNVHGCIGGYGTQTNGGG
jgi:hypothetical protein